MLRGLTGHYVPLPSAAGEKARAFVPNPLPPHPPLDLQPELQELVSQAMLSLGRLDGLAAVLPDPELFIYSYVRKEAVLSSQIEGTQSSLDDLLLFENDATPGVPLDDVQGVSNYVAAMNHGLHRLKTLPLSLRLIKEIHGVLLSKGRGSKKEPGEFRRSQNWVGGSRPGNAIFVPPPPDQILECIGALEKFLHNDPVKTPVLIKAALAHVQFETIHPFLDGNGRLGRLLITFLLCAEGALREPLLYLSLYFKQNRQRYYELLQSVRMTGDWETWLRFFLTGVAETAAQAAGTARALMELAAADEKRIQAIGKASGSALRVHRVLQAQPLISIAAASKRLNLSFPTVTTSLQHLEKLGVVRETTGGKYGRLYAYDRYLKILNAES
ncbi:MAG TPA: Fic family protein [Candidatus Paceibacterota bacterium]|nr:Fic family protein [Verrucomicrobiota bacterium]HSA12567.1 Fic family protein [Candidatus Paceibacterota bacterium]